MTSKSSEEDASKQYEVTLLSVPPEHLSDVAKTIHEDGRISAAGNRTLFFCDKIPFTGLPHLHEIIEEALDHRGLLCLGEAIERPDCPGTLHRQICGEWKGTPQTERRDSGLKNIPQALLPFDIDGFPVPADMDIITNPVEMIDHFIQQHLPDQFHDASYVWHWTGSHGLKTVKQGNDKCWTGAKDFTVAKFRLYFLLAEPLRCEQMSELVKGISRVSGVSCIDTGIYSPAHMIYLRRPIMEGGREDPLQCLQLSGYEERGEDLVQGIPASRIDSVKTKMASTPAVGRYFGSVEEALLKVGKNGVRLPVIFWAGGKLVRDAFEENGKANVDEVLANLKATVLGMKDRVLPLLHDAGRSWGDVEGYLDNPQEARRALQWLIDRCREDYRYRVEVEATYPTDPLPVEEARALMDRAFVEFLSSDVPLFQEWQDQLQALKDEKKLYERGDEERVMIGKMPLPTYASRMWNELSHEEQVRLREDRKARVQQLLIWRNEARSHIERINLEIEAHQEQIPPARTIEVTPGTGKTTAAINQVVAKGGDTLMLQPRHDLMEQTKNNILRQLPYQSADVETLKGRNHIDDDGNQYCQRKDEAELMTANGFDVKSTMCKRGDDVCPYYYGCLYRENMIRLDDAKSQIATHQSAKNNRPLEVHSGKITIVDESSADTIGVRDTDLHKGGLLLSSLQNPPGMFELIDGQLQEVKEESDGYVAAVKVGEAVSKAAKDSFMHSLDATDDMVRAFKLQRVACKEIDIELLDKAVGHYDELHNLSKLMMSPSNSIDDRRTVISNTSMLFGNLRQKIAVLHNIKKFIQHEKQPELAGNVHITGKNSELRIALLRVAGLHSTWSQAPMLQMTATMPPEFIFRTELGRSVERLAKIEAANHDGVVVNQIIDAPVSATKLGTAGGVLHSGQRQEERRGHLVRLIKHKMWEHGSAVVICNNTLKAYLDEQFYKDDRFSCIGFGSVEGTNKFENAPYLMQIGVMDPGADVVGKTYMAHTGIGIEDVKPERVIGGIQLKSGDVVPVTTWQYADKDLQSIYEIPTVHKTMQSLHRIRPVNKQPVGMPQKQVIDYIGNQPIPMRMDRVVKWSDYLCEADVMGLIAEKGLPLSRTHFRVLYPDFIIDDKDLDAVLEQVRNVPWSGGTHTKEYKGEVHPTLGRFSTFRYQVNGRGSAIELMYDPEVVEAPTPESLSAILGVRVKLATHTSDEIILWQASSGVALTSSRQIKEYYPLNISKSVSEEVATQNKVVPDGWIQVNWRPQGNQSKFTSVLVAPQLHSNIKKGIEAALGIEVELKDTFKLSGKELSMDQIGTWRMRALMPTLSEFTH